MAIRLLIHILGIIWLAKFAFGDGLDSVQLTNNAYKGMLMMTIYELTIMSFGIAAIHHLIVVMGGSQVLLMLLMGVVFSTLGLILMCWWTASFGRANKFNKTYVHMNE